MKRRLAWTRLCYYTSLVHSHSHKYMYAYARVHSLVIYIYIYIYIYISNCGARGGGVIKALCYKQEGRGFDSRWCQWNFSVT
jgi:hypothetical protein